MTDRELMQQALDLLDDINQCSLPPTGIPLPAEIDHVIEALRARLAQPEPDEDYEAIANKQLASLKEAGKKTFEDAAVRAFHKLYNAQPEPEPVAWWHDRGDVVDLNVSGHGTPFYTAPPQREWQSLTDENIEDACWTEVDQRLRSFARAIEAKLKEKNHD
jgi:hypothetical protein